MSDDSWRLAQSLKVLLDQVNLLAPGRDKSSDGGRARPEHTAANPTSDHEPDEDGVVKAYDITHDPAHGIDARKLAEALVASRDPRLKYIISNGEIISSKESPWVWRPYNKPNRHFEHVHISVMKDAALYDDQRPWAIAQPKVSGYRPDRFERILATVFADDEVAYADVAPGWNERPGVALPALFTGPRPKVRVTNTANGRSVACEIIDQGPWNYTDRKNKLPGDPYWLTNMRPQAETGRDMIGRETNGAGIDLTKAAAEAIGFKVVVDNTGKILAGGGLVDWEFMPVATGQVMAESTTAFDRGAFFRFIANNRDEAQSALKGGINIFNELYPEVGGVGATLRPSTLNTASDYSAPTPSVPTPPIALKPDNTLDIRAGLLGLLGSLGLAATGVTGTMAGPDATMWGMLTPILSTAAAALGVPAPIMAILGRLVGKRQ